MFLLVNCIVVWPRYINGGNRWALIILLNQLVYAKSQPSLLHFIPQKRTDEVSSTKINQIYKDEKRYKEFKQKGSNKKATHLYLYTR